MTMLTRTTTNTVMVHLLIPFIVPMDPPFFPLKTPPLIYMVMIVVMVMVVRVKYLLFLLHSTISRTQPNTITTHHHQNTYCKTNTTHTVHPINRRCQPRCETTTNTNANVVPHGHTRLCFRCSFVCLKKEQSKTGNRTRLFLQKCLLYYDLFHSWALIRLGDDHTYGFLAVIRWCF